MKCIELTIAALSPLAIGRQKPGGSVSEAEQYIPGTVIRGAIASQILQQSSEQNADFTQTENDFQSLFLSDNSAIFQNAYPATAKSGDVFEIVTEQVKILPATAVSSKTNPGFTPKGHGVFDTLIDRFCAEQYNHPFDPNCPRDGGRVEPFSGFYSRNNQKYRSHSVSTRFLTRVGINRRRATSEDDILYSIEVLNESFLKKSQPQIWESVIYRSYVLIPDHSLATKFINLIDNNPDRFRIGGSTSRGLGKVQIKAKNVNLVNDIESRIKTFNGKLKERWKTWEIFGEQQKQLNKETYFTLNLQSDAILTEQWRSTTVVSPAMLCKFAGLNDEFSSLDDAEKDNFLKLHVAYSSYDYRSGWNAAWGLMKDVELVTNKGAVYLYSTNRPEIWTKKLAELEMQGIGDRTSEGFGQIQVCNEFHLVFRENAV